MISLILPNGTYKDPLTRITYRLEKDIENSQKITLLSGNNGVGKSRFMEGVILPHLKKNEIKALYFGQDIHNQILSFELITLVKEFIVNLKNSGSFFKTILLNAPAQSNIELNFDNRNVLFPTQKSINNFIIRECKKYTDADIILFDEVDKYFKSNQEFHTFISNLKCKNIIVISHIFDSNQGNNSTKTITLTSKEKVVVVE